MMNEGKNPERSAASRAGGHPDHNTLARLADLGPDAVEPEVLKHLAGCAECQAAWAEAARYRGARLIEGEESAVPEELAARARGMRTPGAAPDQRKVITPSRRAWRPAPAFAAGGSLLAAVLALVLLLPNGRDAAGPGDPSQQIVAERLVEQSAWGMVYSGMTGRMTGRTAGRGDSGRPVYRSSDGADAELLTALESIETRWHTGEQDAESTWWLAAGYAAAGRLGLASDLIHQALRRYPGDAKLLHLEAVTAWRMSEFDRAEHALREILVTAPADSTALFNLALVQIETGRTDEAEPLLRALADGSSDPLLRDRARGVLAGR